MLQRFQRWLSKRRLVARPSTTLQLRRQTRRRFILRALDNENKCPENTLVPIGKASEHPGSVWQTPAICLANPQIDPPHMEDARAILTLHLTPCDYSLVVVVDLIDRLVEPRCRVR